MNETFNLVYRFLVFISEFTGLTYQEINIVVYYIITPFVYLFLLDKVFNFHYLKIGFASIVFLFLLFISDFERFSFNAFIASQHFLQSFSWMGLHYIGASVIFCVVLPFLFLLLLISLVYNKKPIKK